MKSCNLTDAMTTEDRQRLIDKYKTKYETLCEISAEEGHWMMLDVLERGILTLEEVKANFCPWAFQPTFIQMYEHDLEVKEEYERAVKEYEECKKLYEEAGLEPPPFKRFYRPPSGLR